MTNNLPVLHYRGDRRRCDSAAVGPDLGGAYWLPVERAYDAAQDVTTISFAPIAPAQWTPAMVTFRELVMRGQG